MISMDSLLSEYLEKFKKLNVNCNKERYTVGKAPHKPTLLLCLIVLHENNRIDLRDIDVGEPALLETWVQLWNELNYSRVGPIHMPLYHMARSKRSSQREDFWHIRFKQGVVLEQPKSFSQFKHMVDSISLDEELVRLVEDKRLRNHLINGLLHGGYYSDEEIKRLSRGIRNLEKSFVYEEKLLNLLHQEFKLEIPKDSFSKRELGFEVRSSAFRRIVLKAYSKRCSFCGMQLETPYGISVIDAAHIVPFSKSYNDNLQNGLALCKTHHWLFDKGLLSVDGHYRILTSGPIESEYPEGVMTGLDGQDIILPKGSEEYPHPTALEWHRKNTFIGE